MWNVIGNLIKIKNRSKNTNDRHYQGFSKNENIRSIKSLDYIKSYFKNIWFI